MPIPTKIVNLTEIYEARAKMTPGEYHAWGTTIMAHEPSPMAFAESALIGTASADDAAGVVATHNAADVLIEVARTLLVYNAAQKEAARCRDAWSRDWDSQARMADFNRTDRAMWSAKAEHEAALAKVSL